MRNEMKMIGGTVGGNRRVEEVRENLGGSKNK